MKKYLMNFKKMIAMLVLSIMAVGVVAQTAEAAGVLDAVGLAGSRGCSGYRKSQGNEYWSYTSGHDFNDRGYGYNIVVYAKMSDQPTYKGTRWVGEGYVDSSKTTNKGNANHKFESASGYKYTWTQN